MSRKYETTEDVQAAMDAVLYRNREAIASGCHAHVGHSPLDELIRREEGDAGEERMVQRQEIFRGLLGYFFADGPEPLDVLRRVYAVVKAVAPDHIGDMSLEDLAVLCGDGGRATTSARIKRIYNRYIEEAGGRSVSAPFQKSAETVGKYQAAQRGNHNRKQGTPRRKRKAS